MRAVIDPSDPAPLTSSPAWEFSPHVSADGTTVVYSAFDVAPAGLPGFERFALNLAPPCRESVIERLSDDDEPSGGDGTTFPPQVSVSADGTLVAWAPWTGSSTTDFQAIHDVVVLDRTTGTTTVLGQVHVDEIAGSQPRPHLSADGSHVLVMDSFVSGASVVPRSRRFATDPSCSSGCDCAVQLNTANALAATQSAINDDGTVMVGQGVSGGDTFVRRITMDEGTCTVTSTETIAEPTGNNVTIADDGLTMAWTTNADYDMGGTHSVQYTWVWKSDTVSPCPGEECVTSPAGGTLVRIEVNSVNVAHELPFVSRDGDRAFFISEGNFNGENVDLDRTLWVVDLTNSSSWYPQRVASLRTGIDLAEVRTATASRDGKTVAYEEHFDSDDDDVLDQRDLFLVQVDHDLGSDLADPDDRPAHVPFELDDVACTHEGADQIEIQWDLRQFRGGDRQLVMVAEVQGDGGTIHRTSPLVQRLRDEYVAQTTRTLTLNDGDPDDLVTCRVQVIDGSKIQPDAVTAEEAP